MSSFVSYRIGQSFILNFNKWLGFIPTIKGQQQRSLLLISPKKIPQNPNGLTQAVQQQRSTLLPSSNEILHHEQQKLQDQLPLVSLASRGCAPQAVTVISLSATPPYVSRGLFSSFTPSASFEQQQQRLLFISNSSQTSKTVNHSSTLFLQQSQLSFDLHGRYNVRQLCIRLVF